jgi:phosphoglycolate phosphatase
MMLGALGRPPLDVELIRTFVGKGIANLVDRALSGHIDGGADPALIARAMPIYERCYDEVNGKHTTIYPGVKEGLAGLEEQGFPLACVTNKSMRFAQPLLEMLGLARHFRELIGGDTLARKKPDPAPLVHASEKLRVSPGDMLMIGDSINDTEAARAAGCTVF